jgi:hypothetical protein
MALQLVVERLAGQVEHLVGGLHAAALAAQLGGEDR